MARLNWNRVRQQDRHARYEEAQRLEPRRKKPNPSVASESQISYLLNLVSVAREQLERLTKEQASLLIDYAKLDCNALGCKPLSPAAPLLLRLLRRVMEG